MRKKESDDTDHLILSGKRLRELTKTVVKKFPVYDKELAATEIKITRLEALRQKMYGEISLTTLLKSNAKENAIRAVLLLQNGVKLYALSERKKSLYKASSYAYSDFNRPVPGVTLARMQQVLNAAKRIKNYKKFAITKAIISDAEKKVKKFKNQIYLPGEHIKEKARWAKESRRMISDIKQQLKTRLLPLFEIIKKDRQYESECNHFYAFLKMKRRGRPKGSRTEKNTDKKIKSIRAKDVSLVKMIHGQHSNHKVNTEKKTHTSSFIPAIA